MNGGQLPINQLHGIYMGALDKFSCAPINVMQLYHNMTTMCMYVHMYVGVFTCVCDSHRLATKVYIDKLQAA